jgi:hypothetical protein
MHFSRGVGPMPWPRATPALLALPPAALVSTPPSPAAQLLPQRPALPAARPQHLALVRLLTAQVLHDQPPSSPPHQPGGRANRPPLRGSSTRRTRPRDGAGNGTPAAPPPPPRAASRAAASMAAARACAHSTRCSPYWPETHTRVTPGACAARSTASWSTGTSSSVSDGSSGSCPLSQARRYGVSCAGHGRPGSSKR